MILCRNLLGPWLSPGNMLGDRTGEVAKTIGMLDTLMIHLAYSARFLMNMKGVVQAVKEIGRARVVLVLEGWGLGKVLNLAM